MTTTDGVIAEMLGSRHDAKADLNARMKAAHRIHRNGHQPRPIETRPSNTGRPWHRAGRTCPWLSKPSPDVLDVVWAQIVHLQAQDVAT